MMMQKYLIRNKKEPMIEFDKAIKFLNTIYKGTNFGKQFRMDNQALLSGIHLARNSTRRSNNSIDVKS